MHHPECPIIIIYFKVTLRFFFFRGEGGGDAPRSLYHQCLEGIPGIVLETCIVCTFYVNSISCGVLFVKAAVTSFSCPLLIFF